MLMDFIDLNTRIQRLFEVNLVEFNLTINQYKILKCIYESDSNEILAIELVKLLDMDKKSVSISLKALEKSGKIIRFDYSEDKRLKYICLSDEFLDAFPEIIILEEEESNFIFENTSIQEKESIRDFYCKVKKNIDKRDYNG